ncbi:MAG: protein-L-isoaspartate(D-aspartate) O-methyltransferase [Phycisphaerae bacterium]
MQEPKDKHAARRLAMVRRQIAARGIEDTRICQAMADIPRHIFVPESRQNQSYEDTPLPIGAGQTISQPYVVAMMLETLDVQPDSRVLDIGAGSGYQTALLARLARHVWAIERVESLADRARQALERLEISNVTLRCGDGTLGWPEEAPFDRIICGAGGPEVPEAWVQQLAPEGRLVMPVGDEIVQQLVLVTRQEGQIHKEQLGAVRFVKLIGREGWPEQ